MLSAQLEVLSSEAGGIVGLMHAGRRLTEPSTSNRALSTEFMPSTPLRALTAVALCDGHDAGIVAVSRALRHRGFEVIYIGFHKSPRQIVRAAVQEDVDVIGIASYNGGHFEFIDDVLKHLRESRRTRWECRGRSRANA